MHPGISSGAPCAPAVSIIPVGHVVILSTIYRCRAMGSWKRARFPATIKINHHPSNLWTIIDRPRNTRPAFGVESTDLQADGVCASSYLPSLPILSTAQYPAKMRAAAIAGSVVQSGSCKAGELEGSKIGEGCVCIPRFMKCTSCLPGYAIPDRSALAAAFGPLELSSTVRLKVPFSMEPGHGRSGPSGSGAGAAAGTGTCRYAR